MNGPAYLGGAPGGSWALDDCSDALDDCREPHGLDYAGSFAGVQILPKELDEASCKRPKCRGRATRAKIRHGRVTRVHAPR
jgi:hypothetical protein